MFVLVACSARSQNFNLTLLGQKTYAPQSLSNIWGYVDTTGKEYALVGAQNGLSIVDVTNPASPVEVKVVAGPSSQWREIKTIGKYAYVTTENGTVGLQCVNLSSLPNVAGITSANWTPTINGQTLQTIHALHASGNRLYLYGSNIGVGGVLIADVTANPMNPTYLGRYNVSYVHDGEVRGNYCYASHIYNGNFTVMDVSNPANPVDLATQSTPSNFTHNTWTSTNWNYLFTTDEVSNSYLTSYDITNINNIKELDRVQLTPGSGSIVHNTYTIQKAGNDYEVVSWYKDGLAIVDVGKPDNMVVMGWYDTYTQGSGNGFNGCWGVYPYLPSGNIVASDINNGLYILGPTYQRAAYLEGIITDANTSAPLFNATAQLSANNTDNSDATGKYGLGVSTAGTYSCTYSKPGYFSQTINNISLTNGNTTVVNVQLVPMTPFAYTGTVKDAQTNIGIPAANVRMWNSNFTYDTITDANGNFNFPTVYAGTYEIIAGKWGHVTKCSSLNLNNLTPPITILLNAGIYDDFTWDWLWTKTNTATTGLWQRGKPNGTTCTNPNDANPPYDVPNDCADQAYVTGNGGTACADDDIDGGWVTLTSPTFDLSAYANPYVKYSRWFYNGQGNGLPNDSLKIKITNGSTSVTLETVTPLTAGMSTWVPKMFQINGLIPLTNNMKVHARAVDYGTGHVVEAGFDFFRVIDSVAAGQNMLEQSYHYLNVFPNPFTGQAQVQYHLGKAPSDDAKIMVMDITGRVLREEKIESVDGIIQLGSETSTGVYLVTVKNGDEVILPVKAVKVK